MQDTVGRAHPANRRIVTSGERQTLDGLFQMMGATAAKVDMILLNVGGIDERLRKVEDAAVATSAIAADSADRAEKRTVSKRWIVQVIVTAVGVTAGVVFGIVGLLSR